MQANDTPTRLLRDEHKLILEVAGVLEKILDGDSGDFDSIGDCVTFIRLFADANHHGKEEDLLFPALEARGMPRSGGPVAVMLEEHRQGRELVQAMAGSLDAARGGDEDSRQALSRAGRGFVELIRAHIYKEDNILFNMADRLVDEAACRRLTEAYDEVCRRSFEGKSRDELMELAARLQEKYPVA